MSFLVLVRAVPDRYALKIAFDDGHDSGLYSWELPLPTVLGATNKLMQAI